MVCTLLLCLLSVVLIKSLLLSLSLLHKFLNLAETLSVNFNVSISLSLAEFSTFCPCSSVPVKKNTSKFDNLLYLDMLSATKLV